VTTLQRSVFKTAAITSIFLLIAYLSLLLAVNSSNFQKWIMAQIAARTGYEITARNIRLVPPLRLSLTEMALSGAGRTLIQAERAVIVLSPTVLFSRTIDRLELERPILTLDLYDSFAVSKSAGWDVSIRRLNVQDGTVVLISGAARRMDLRSVTINAENVNVGSDIGLRLRAAIPSLQGTAQITVRGTADQIEAVILLDQNGGSSRGTESKSSRTLTTKVHMARQENGAVRISGEGELDGMRLAEWRLDGGLAISAGLQPDGHENGLNGSARFSVQTLRLRRTEQVAISAETIRSEVKVKWPENEPVQLSGSMQIEQAAFASTDGTKMGEQLSLDARLDSVRMDSGLSIAGRIDLRQGEVLWNKFYSDLKIHRPALEFDLDYHPEEDRLRLRQVEFGLAPLGNVAVHGDLTNLSNSPVVQIRIAGNAIETAGVYQLLIRDTLNRRYPFLDHIIATGQLDLSASVSGPLDQPLFEGALALHAGEIRAQASDWRLSGVNLSLPFRLAFSGALEPPSDPGPTGKLTVASAKIGAEVVPAVHAVVSLWDNALRMHQPIRLPMYGGSVVISDLAWKDVVKSPQAVSLSIKARNLQLQRLTEALGWHRFGGSLSASVPKIEWTGESLRSEGQIDVAVFGGRVHMSLLQIDNPFSAIPSIRLDARVEDILLEQASETFAFGRISGVLVGTIDKLVITAGQPSSFTADLHSVERPGVSQRISVESLNKITVLSSGQKAGTLYGGIAGLFDSFRYSKLGFRATLKNDKLTLRGVESRGGQEYLVVGSLVPPTVNVISHTQEIAFQELLRRIEQIQSSAHSQKPSG
jgi:hypothetical protein